MRLILVLLWLFTFFPSLTNAQCFRGLRGEGNQQMRAKNYEEAINNYLAALSCPDRPRDNDLPELIKKALQARVQELETARKETERALTLARQREKEARAAALAAKARQVAVFDHSVAIQLAWAAFQLHPEGQDPAEALRDLYREKDIHFYQSVYHHLGNIVSDLDISADDQWVATACLDSMTYLWSRDGQIIRKLPHTTGVNHVAFSPDMRYLVTGSIDERVRKWSLEGQLLATSEPLVGGQSEVGINGLAIAPNGMYLLAGTFGGQLLLLDTLLNTLIDFGNVQIGDIAFAPDSQSFLFCGGDYDAFWYSIKGELIQTLKGHQQFVMGVNFSPDGNQIVTCAQDKTARVWNTDGEEILVLDDHEGSVRAAAFSPLDSTIITVGTDNKIRQFDYNGSLLATYLGHSDVVNTLKMSHEGYEFYTSAFDGTAKRWDLRHTPELRLNGHNDFVNSIEVSSDHQFILSTSMDGTVKVFNRNGNGHYTMPNTFGNVTMASFDETNTRMLFVTGEGGVYILNQEQEYDQSWDPETTNATVAKYTDDYQKVIIGHASGQISIWEVKTGKELKRFESNQGGILTLATAKGEPLILSSGKDDSVILFDFEGQKVTTLPFPDCYGAPSVAFSNDNQYLATGGGCGKVFIWNRQGELVDTYTDLWDGVLAVSFSPDDKYVLANCIIGPAKIWRFSDGQELQTAYPINGSSSTSAFSPDGKYFLVGDSSGGIRLVPRFDELLSNDFLPPLTTAQKRLYKLTE